MSTHVAKDTNVVLVRAEERRATLLRTALRAFAARGFYGTSTAEVARQADIALANVHVLFPDKQSLFAAVVEDTFGRISAALEQGAAAAGGDTPSAVLAEMDDAYARLIVDRDLLLVQLHAQTTAASDPAIRQVVRDGYAALVQQVRLASMADDEAIQRFFAKAFLRNAVTALSVDQVHARWADTLMTGLHFYAPLAG